MYRENLGKRKKKSKSDVATFCGLCLLVLWRCRWPTPSTASLEASQCPCSVVIPPQSVPRSVPRCTLGTDLEISREVKGRSALVPRVAAPPPPTHLLRHSLTANPAYSPQLNPSTPARVTLLLAFRLDASASAHMFARCALLPCPRCQKMGSRF